MAAGKVLGFVGLGRMGAPMAGHLMDAGHELAVYDRAEDAMAPLLARGARRCASPAEVASAAEVVLASLPTPDVVKQVALGEDGVLRGNRVTTFVDLSTTGPRVAAQVAEEFACSGRERVTVDAPVSGGVSGAERGTLAVMVSCPRPSFEELEPVLRVFGQPFFLGERPGSAQSIKLANYLLAAPALAVSSEAIVMGVKAGLDPKLMVEVINAGSGRNSATQDKFPRAVLPRTFDFGFATGLSYKDVRLCVDEAEALGVPMVVGSAVRQLLAVTNATFGAESDFTNVVRTVEQWAGVEVRG